MYFFSIALARIMEAFEEYDELGSKAYRMKYGCSLSRRWVVLRRGKAYPARAILEAAFANEYRFAVPTRVFPPRITGWEYSYVFSQLNLQVERRNG